MWCGYIEWASQTSRPVLTQAKLSLNQEREMASKIFRVFLTLFLASPALSLFFGPPSKVWLAITSFQVQYCVTFSSNQKSTFQNCRSDRDCPGFRRTTCEGRGPNFLFIFPTCARFLADKHNSDPEIMVAFRERPYTVPGKCDVVPDTLCNIGSECVYL